jgi:nitrite reductase (NADH) small subunit
MAHAEAVVRVRLGQAEAIPPGEGRAFVVAGEAVAVFRTRSGRLFATQAFCPHARGPLADGLIGSTTVLCPLHTFAFDLETGRCLADGGCADLRVYGVSLTAEGEILLELPARGALAGERGTAA